MSRGLTEEKSCAVFDVNEYDTANPYLVRNDVQMSVTSGINHSQSLVPGWPSLDDV
jgi:hypothetical protein